MEEAVNFALDIQETMQKEGSCMSDLKALAKTIKVVLPNYPGCKVSDVITFSDGSIAKVTTAGIVIE